MTTEMRDPFDGEALHNLNLATAQIDAACKVLEEKGIEQMFRYLGESAPLFLGISHTWPVRLAMSPLPSEDVQETFNRQLGAMVDVIADLLGLLGEKLGRDCRERVSVERLRNSYMGYVLGQARPQDLGPEQ